LPSHLTVSVIFRGAAATTTMSAVADELPLTARDVSITMEALFDIRRDVHEILPLLRDDDEEEEEDA